MMLKKLFLFWTILVFVGCGEVTTGSPTQTPETEEAEETEVTEVTVSGTITYDSIPFKGTGTSGLDYHNIVQKNVRGAVVEIVDATGKVLGETSTDSRGAYSIRVIGTRGKVRVSAKLYKAVSSGEASWDFQVKDNTNSNALYVMEGSLANLGKNSRQTRNLNASSGWDGSSYSSKRTAAPFAILDVVYQAIEKVTTAQSDTTFDPLNIFWSKNNVATNGKKSLGQITTSHYDNTALYILGKENSDTDEYDSAVIGHEWGHYYESQFSRSDSIGGPHGSGDMLDIRVAFGEGFGTAIGCMIIDSPLYIDSLGSKQGATGVFANLEEGGSRINAGWYNETSIYSIIYDVFDSDDDAGDTLSLGFSPIHNLFIGSEKNTEAFTSIFTFITALKAENPGNDIAIDAITSNESIAPITDIYGTGRINRASQNANPLYSSLSVGGSVDLLTNYSATATSIDNKLGAYNFVRFTIPSSGTYTINISQVGGTGSPDPDILLYKGASNHPIAVADAIGTTDRISTVLSAGTYRMAVIVYAQKTGHTFRVTLN